MKLHECTNKKDEEKLHGQPQERQHENTKATCGGTQKRAKLPVPCNRRLRGLPPFPHQLSPPTLPRHLLHSITSFANLPASWKVRRFLLFFSHESSRGKSYLPCTKTWRTFVEQPLKYSEKESLIEHGYQNTQRDFFLLQLLLGISICVSSLWTCMWEYMCGWYICAGSKCL